jgi:putative transposase
MARRVFTSVNGSEALRAKSTPPDGVWRVETGLPQMGVTCPGIRPLCNTIWTKERGRKMSKSRQTEAQMIAELKQVEAGRSTEDVAREQGVSKHTIYAWKAKYGGMEVSEAEEVKQLRDENARLKKLVADLSLDKDMLQMEATIFSAWIYDTLKPYAERLGMGHRAKMKALLRGRRKAMPSMLAP